MCYKNDKNIKFVISRFVFSSSKCTKIRFRPGPGLCPGPRWGSLRRSPRPCSRLGNPLPIPLPRSTPSAYRTRRLRRLGSQAPSTQNPGYATEYIPLRYIALPTSLQCYIGTLNDALLCDTVGSGNRRRLSDDLLCE